MPKLRKHGGKRPGSGRPRSGKFTRSYFVTDIEDKELKAVLAKIRAGSAAFTLPGVARSTKKKGVV